MKVLIVDDSIVFRMAIKQSLEGHSKITHIDSVSNGQLAVDYLQKNPDCQFVTMDIEMPVMDGIAAVKEIRKFNKKVRIVMFSSMTLKGAEKTIEALDAGADDFVSKVETKSALNMDECLKLISDSLLPKFDALVKNDAHKNTSINISSGEVSWKSYLNYRPDLIVIGCSTGGPDALTKIFSALQVKLTIPILLVQHMPPIFTQKLAESLDRHCPHGSIYEAIDGQLVEKGGVYIAPGDFHMTLKRDMRLSLNQNEKVCFVRPSVNVTLDSVNDCYAGKVCVMILTGMGDDGASSCAKLVKNNHECLIQNKESSSVWGMPGAIERLNIAHKEIDLSLIPKLLDSLNKV